MAGRAGGRRNAKAIFIAVVACLAAPAPCIKVCVVVSAAAFGSAGEPLAMLARYVVTRDR